MSHLLAGQARIASPVECNLNGRNTGTVRDSRFVKEQEEDVFRLGYSGGSQLG